MIDSTLKFSHFIFSGPDATKFLQGQVTSNVENQTKPYQASAICNLKGRVEFGLWINKIEDSADQNIAHPNYDIVVATDCAEALVAHIKKFSAFSKVNVSDITEIYPCVVDMEHGENTFFSIDEKLNTLEHKQQWAKLSIAHGNYWITKDNQSIYQPQELRLHQRDGVDYTKGCYLGQEVIARIYFKSVPKAYLHRVQGIGALPPSGTEIGEKGKIQVINAILPISSKGITKQDAFEALVIARPKLIEEAINSGLLIQLPLPTELQAEVARH